MFYTYKDCHQVNSLFVRVIFKHEQTETEQPQIIFDLGKEEDEVIWNFSDVEERDKVFSELQRTPQRIFSDKLISELQPVLKAAIKTLEDYFQTFNGFKKPSGLMYGIIKRHINNPNGAGVALCNNFTFREEIILTDDLYTMSFKSILEAEHYLNNYESFIQVEDDQILSIEELVYRTEES